MAYVHLTLGRLAKHNALNTLLCRLHVFEGAISCSLIISKMADVDLPSGLITYSTSIGVQ